MKTPRLHSIYIFQDENSQHLPTDDIYRYHHLQKNGLYGANLYCMQYKFAFISLSICLPLHPENDLIPTQYEFQGSFYFQLTFSRYWKVSSTPFGCSLSSRIRVLIPSSFANDQFRRVSTTLLHHFKICCCGFYMKRMKFLHSSLLP